MYKLSKCIRNNIYLWSADTSMKQSIIWKDKDKLLNKFILTEYLSFTRNLQCVPLDLANE